MPPSRPLTGWRWSRSLATHPPLNAGYQPRQQLMVIALGRLGMREFDLASDADLVFVLPDEDHEEHLFWTRVAERMIDLHHRLHRHAA